MVFWPVWWLHCKSKITLVIIICKNFFIRPFSSLEYRSNSLIYKYIFVFVKCLKQRCQEGLWCSNASVGVVRGRQGKAGHTLIFLIQPDLMPAIQSMDYIRNHHLQENIGQYCDASSTWTNILIYMLFYGFSRCWSTMDCAAVQLVRVRVTAIPSALFMLCWMLAACITSQRLHM